MHPEPWRARHGEPFEPNRFSEPKGFEGSMRTFPAFEGLMFPSKLSPLGFQLGCLSWAFVGGCLLEGGILRGKLIRQPPFGVSPILTHTQIQACQSRNPQIPFWFPF